jgi:hypothetical protein
VKVRVMLDIAVPVGGRHSVDAVPVPGRHMSGCWATVVREVGDSG